MDFDTGKLVDVARHVRPNRQFEYALLCAVLGISSIPYVALFAIRPFSTTCVVFFMAYFQVLIAFATSTSSDTAHHIRFLLCGSNPIGMTGASSLLFGAVDSIVDWREDTGERRRQPAKYWLLTVYKLMMTPIGALLMLLEYAWDVCLMLRPGLVRNKWNELFSLAYYHNLVCPEKSNDIFYADLANARFRNDVHLYQWNRMREMVFELKHYSMDAQNGVGVSETNVFLQDEISAYQTLKRLQLESIEEELDTYYGKHIDRFPVPASLARQLINNAQPIGHYLRMRRELGQAKALAGPPHANGLSALFGERSSEPYGTWHVLRLLDANAGRITASLSRYITNDTLEAMQHDGILAQSKEGEFQFDADFLARFELFLQEHFTTASQAQASQTLLNRVPTLLYFRGKPFVPSDNC